MAYEIEKNSEAEDPVEGARNIYREYALSSKETWKQEWKDKFSEASAEDLANFYASEGGDSNQVVFYLEAAKLDEREKWAILAQNFEARADFAYQKADEAGDKKEIERLKTRVNVYKEQAQALRRGTETLDGK